MSVYSEKISQAENSEHITENGFEDVSLETDFGDVQENLEIVTQVDISVENPTEFHEIAAAASSTVQLISGIPNGIYAFESNVGSNMFMKSAKSSPQDGDSMTIFQQNNASSMPYIRGLPVATFEITKKESSGTYIIRLGANESLTLAISGTSVITKSIPENDSDVAIEDTFYISSYAGGYTIRPYSSNSYIASKTDSSGLTVMASINNRAIWFPRGYRAYIDDGVYALLNRENTTSWIGTAENDFLGTKLARTYERSTCPAADFQRNCLFKITQIGTSGEYVIRLMTNNLLTWSVRTDGKVFSRPISYDDSQITDTSQKYYIVFDKNSFMLLPCSKPKTALVKEDSEALDEFGETVSYISTVERVNATNSARWLMYKYIGPDRCGADIILPDEIESIGAIVGNTYTISHTVWYTKEDMFDFSVSAIDSSFNDVSFEYDSDNYTATMTVHNLGEISYYVLSKRMVDGVPMMSISADVSFYVIPKEDTYYLQNSQSNLYANVINHSTDNGAIIHQLGFSTDSRFKWEIEHVEDSGGYVLLKSQLSNMYMGVDLDSSSTQTRIRQYEDVGDNTLWRFETLDNGSVKIICKATESSGKVLAVPNVLPGTGEWLTQYTYTDDQNRNDEWNLIYYSVYIEFRYDLGYITRNKEDQESDEIVSDRISNNIIYTYFPHIRAAFAERCGLNIILNQTIVPLYISDADLCDPDIDKYCDCIDEEECTLEFYNNPNYNNSINGFQYGVHCKSMVRIRNNLIMDIPDNTIRVAYTGHVACLYSNGDHGTNTIGLSDYTYPIISMRISQDNRDNNILVLAHELTHLYGIYHHSPASNGKHCIMDSKRYEYNDPDDYTTYWCDECINTIIQNITKY